MHQKPAGVRGENAGSLRPGSDKLKALRRSQGSCCPPRMLCLPGDVAVSDAPGPGPGTLSQLHAATHFASLSPLLLPWRQQKCGVSWVISLSHVKSRTHAFMQKVNVLVMKCLKMKCEASGVVNQLCQSCLPSPAPAGPPQSPPQPAPPALGSQPGCTQDGSAQLRDDSRKGAAAFGLLLPRRPDERPQAVIPFPTTLRR